MKQKVHYYVEKCDFCSKDYVVKCKDGKRRCKEHFMKYFGIADHKEGNCDKCNKKVGVRNLKALPFLYLDRNDKIHNDWSNKPEYKDYKQYFVCEQCYKKEIKRMGDNND